MTSVNPCLTHITFTAVRKGRPVDLEVKVFSNLDSLCRHCKDHFFSENEPWDRVWSRDCLNQARKKLTLEEVITADFYDLVVKVANSAVQYSLDLPLYVWAIQAVKPQEVLRETLFCIAEDGFVIVSDRQCLWSMYFHVSIAGNPSKYELFRDAWKDISRKLRRPYYEDDKYQQTYVNIECEWLSQENWYKCPNPHPPARTRVPRAEWNWEIRSRKYSQSGDDNDA